MATPTKWGTEFLANTIIAGDQRDSVVTGLTNGRFVVAWVDDSTAGIDKSGSAVRGQIFNADGSKAGAEFAINTDPLDLTGNQDRPTITALADGGFMVGWNDSSTFGGHIAPGTIAQILHADGTVSGGAFSLDMPKLAAQQNPSIAQLANGHIVATWDDNGPSVDDASSSAIRGQLFNTDGAKLGGTFLVNLTTQNVQTDSSVAALKGGGFVVAWTDQSMTGGDIDSAAIRAQIFKANGIELGSEFLVNTTVPGNQDQPSVTALAGGGFVVTFSDQSQSGGDQSSYAMRAQVYTENGAKVGGEFLVNTTTQGFQGWSDVAALHDGRFVIAWDDYSQSADDTQDVAVRAQVFNADGSKSGAEFLVNTFTESAQARAHIGVLADGRFVISFIDYSKGTGDFLGAATSAQIFDPREIGVTVTGTAQNDDYVGSAFHDVLNGGSGNDHLVGAGGDDTIDGGAGNDTAGYSGARADYHVDQLANGDLQITDLRAGSPDGTDTVRNIENFSFSDGTFAASPAINVVEAKNDFDGNGHSDILWQHTSGFVSAWLMNAGQIGGNSGLGTPGALHFQDSGDFNGDGHADALWRADSGEVELWTLNGAQIGNDQSVAMIGNDWHNQGVGDFNADGRADVLWRNDSGQVALWTMDGAQITGNQQVATAGNEWHVQGLGDFDGDGKSDVLLRSDAGQVVQWTMDGSQIVANQSIANVGLDWHVAGTGDFNADGRSDVLLRNDSGQVALWTMNGSQIVSNDSVATIGPQWHIDNVGDYNHDGHSDVLLRSDSGQVVMWEMNGAQIVANHEVMAQGGQDAHIGLDWTVLSHHYDLV